MCEITRAVDEGTPLADADAALRPLGLPMSPFVILQLVGPPIVLHVAQTLHDALGDRFWVSPTWSAWSRPEGRACTTGRRMAKPYVSDETAACAVGDRASTSDQVRDRTLTALAEEIGLMLAEACGSCNGCRSLPDPGRWLAPPPRRHHPLPRQPRVLRAGAGPATAAPGVASPPKEPAATSGTSHP